MPPALILISFIAFVAFVFGLFYIYGNVPYWRLLGIYKQLKIKFAFSYTRKFMKAKITASGHINGWAVTISPRDIEAVPFLHILLEGGGRFLPEPLQLVKNRAAAPGEYGPSEALRIDPAEIPAINRSIGRPVLDRETTGLLELLKARTSDFAFYGGTGSLMIAFDAATAAAIEESASAAAQLMARLKKTARTANLALHALICRVWDIAEYDERRAALHLLIERYRNDPLTRETLAAVKDGPDFGLGRLAAEALGVSPLSYVRSCFDRLDDADKLKAVRLLAKPGIEGGTGFLIGCYGKAKHPDLREAVIEALGTCPWHKRTAALFITALKDEAVKVRLAAVEALAEKGRADALAPLHALSRDKRHSALAAKAKEASAAIRRRLGLKETEAGQLSLAGNDDESGRLSLAGAEESGSLSLADQDAADDSPSPEKRKH